MSTTTTNSTTDAIQVHLQSGYDAAEQIALLTFGVLSVEGAEMSEIVREIFDFAFRAGVELGHELGHMCADAEAEVAYSPPGYL